jgi:hypothetical protein
MQQDKLANKAGARIQGACKTQADFCRRGDTLLGYEFTTRTSCRPTGPRSTTSSMLLRITENSLFATSSLQITPKNFCTLRNSFCEIRLHVE